VPRLRPLYYNEERDHKRSMANHRELLQAIESHDAQAAVRLVGDMFRYSEDRIRSEAERGAPPQRGHPAGAAPPSRPPDRAPPRAGRAGLDQAAAAEARGRCTRAPA